MWWEQWPCQEREVKSLLGRSIIKPHWTKGWERRKCFAVKWRCQNWQGKVKTDCHCNQHCTKHSRADCCWGWPRKNTCYIFPVFTSLHNTLLPHFSLPCIFLHSVFLKPFPHPGLLICGMMYPGDEDFSCWGRQLPFYSCSVCSSILTELL